MDSIQAWEIFATLGVKGEEELKTKLQDITTLATSTQAALDKLGKGGPAVAGGKAAPLQTSMLYGGGVGGGPGPGQGASQSPTSPAGGPDAVGKGGGGTGGGGGGGGQGASNSPTAPAGGPRGIPTGAELVARSNAKAAAAQPTRSTIGALQFQDYSWMNNRTGAPGPIPASRLLKNADEVEAERIAGQKKPAIGALHYPELRERVSGGLMGGELVGIGARKLAAELAETAKKSKGAGDNIHQLGLRHAWIIRSATAGGPLGMTGGALGAAIGGLAGNPGFGALMGNLIGQSITSGVNRMHGAVGTAVPASALRFERAQADLSASFGRILVPGMEKATDITRQFADVIASNESGLTKSFKGFLDLVQRNSTILKYLEDEASKPGVMGASQNKAISPLGGKAFGSADELYRSVAGMVMMYSDVGGGVAGGAPHPGFALTDTEEKMKRREFLANQVHMDTLGPAGRRQAGETMPDYMNRLDRIREMMLKQPRIVGPPDEEGPEQEAINIINGAVGDFFKYKVVT